MAFHALISDVEGIILPEQAGFWAMLAKEGNMLPQMQEYFKNYLDDQWTFSQSYNAYWKCAYQNGLRRDQIYKVGQKQTRDLGAAAFFDSVRSYVGDRMALLSACMDAAIEPLQNDYQIPFACCNRLDESYDTTGRVRLEVTNHNKGIRYRDLCDRMRVLPHKTIALVDGKEDIPIVQLSPSQRGPVIAWGPHDELRKASKGRSDVCIVDKKLGDTMYMLIPYLEHLQAA